MMALEKVIYTAHTVATSRREVTVKTDDAEVDRKGAVAGVLNRNKAGSASRGLGGLLG